MARLSDLAESKSDAFMIDPRKITVDPAYNLRDLTTPDALESLDELGASIEASGVRVPLLVRKEADDTIVLVQGHRRHAAIMALIAKGVPFAAVKCLAEDKKRSNEDRTLDLFLSNDGEPLTELEKAEGVMRLFSYGWERAHIAAKLGKSVAYIRELEAYANQLPERIKASVRDGQVAASTALRVVREEGAEVATEIIQETQAEAEAEAEAGVPPILLATGAEKAPKAKKVTQKRIEATKAKRDGITSAPKPKARGQNMSALYDALFTQINKFLGKCIDGTYEKYDGDTVPDRLVSDATAMAETIKAARAGFKDTEADAA